MYIYMHIYIYTHTYIYTYIYKIFNVTILKTCSLSKKIFNFLTIQFIFMIHIHRISFFYKFIQPQIRLKIIFKMK